MGRGDAQRGTGRIWDGSSRDGIALSGTCALGNRMGTASASQSHGVTLTARARGSGDETHRQVVACRVCRASSCSANVNRNCAMPHCCGAAGGRHCGGSDGPACDHSLVQLAQFRLTRPDGLVGHWRANRVAVHSPVAGCEPGDCRYRTVGHGLPGASNPRAMDTGKPVNIDRSQYLSPQGRSASTRPVVTSGGRAASWKMEIQTPTTDRKVLSCDFSEFSRLPPPN